MHTFTYTSNVYLKLYKVEMKLDLCHLSWCQEIGGFLDPI